MKMTPRIPPKNAATFAPGNVIRLEFPAQGYVNTGKTTLEFDVDIVWNPNDEEGSYVRFQNNIQSIFNRVRLLYGATPLEDIPYYNVLVRQLTEWTGTGSFDQTSINEGIGGVSASASRSKAAELTSGNALFNRENVNIRQDFIHGIDTSYETNFLGVSGSLTGSVSRLKGAGAVPNQAVAPDGSSVGTLITAASSGRIHNFLTNGYPTRRYQVQLMLGIFNQEKLIPTKYMASQLAIEITLENASACMYYQASSSVPTPPTTSGATEYGRPGPPPTYRVRNVNLLPEVLEFDSSYDETFLRGLQENGVPIKFCTWNNFRFSNNGVSSVNLQIQERSRSVKSIFVMQRRDPPTFSSDSGATFSNTAVTGANTPTAFQEYQFRIGGRYYFSKTDISLRSLYNAQQKSEERLATAVQKLM